MKILANILRGKDEWESEKSISKSEKRIFFPIFSQNRSFDFETSKKYTKFILVDEDFLRLSFKNQPQYIAISPKVPC